LLCPVYGGNGSLVGEELTGLKESNHGSFLVGLHGLGMWNKFGFMLHAVGFWKVFGLQSEYSCQMLDYPYNKFVNSRPSGWTAKYAASQQSGPLQKRYMLSGFYFSKGLS